MKPGDRVRMTEAFKAKMRGDCLPGNHIAPKPGEPPLESDLPDYGCMHCSTDHIEEFGECIGIIEGLMDWNGSLKNQSNYDPKKVGPECEVYWQPSNLRYTYHPNNLELVGEEK